MNDQNIPAFQKSIESQLIEELYRGLDINEVKTYAEIEHESGVDIQDKRHTHTTAQKACMKDGIAIETVVKVGVKRLDQPGVIERAKGGTIRVHKTIGRERKKLTSCVLNPKALKPEELHEYNSQRSVLEMLNYLSKGKSIDKVREIAHQTNNALPVQKTIEAFWAIKKKYSLNDE